MTYTVSGSPSDSAVIVIPSGKTGLGFWKEAKDPIYGNRQQTFSYSLQTNDGAPRGALVGVTGGNVEWQSNAQIKSGGKLTVVQTDPDKVDWLHRRVKITMHIEGLGDYPLGVFIPSAPSQRWDGMNLTLDIDLLDKTSVLADDSYGFAYHLPQGTNVTSAVKTLIQSCGEQAGSITSTSDTLNSGMTWQPGTSKLTIINDLLSAGNFFSLFADGNGNFRVEQQRPAKSRPIQFTFVDNSKGVYLPDFTYDKDVYSIPNKVVVIGNGDGATEAWTAVATNENANSPYSYQARGRWITDVTTGVEATSQANLQEYANRRLAQLSAPQGVVTIQHAALPWLSINDAVIFRRSMAGLDMRCVLTSIQIPLDETGLATSALTEVIDLG